MKNKMKVLQLPSWYIPEGGQFCLEQSKALKKQGINVKILANVTLPWKKYNINILKYPISTFWSTEENIETFRYYSWRIPLLHMENITKWINKTLTLFDEYIKQVEKPDIIHTHSSMWGGVAAARIKEKYNIPYVLTEHQGLFGQKSNLSKEQILPEYVPLYKEAFSNADYIIPVSEQQIKKISSFFNKEEIPIKAISNIVDIDFFSSSNNKKDNEKFIFFTANSYCAEKAYDILLPAFDIVCEEISNVQLRIAGRNFLNNKEFCSLLKTTKNKEKIEFCGYLSPLEIRNELWNADSFVLSSRIESQSISVLESLSTGLPVVCTEVVPKQVCKDFCGYHVPIENPEALAQAMIEMVKNRKNFDKQKIRSHVESIASPQVVASQIIEIYEEVLLKMKK